MMLAGENNMESLRPHVRILMCTGGEQDFSRIFTLTFNKYLGAKYDFETHEIPSAKRFLEYAEREHVDVFLIILNNMFPDAEDLFPAGPKVVQGAPGSLKVDQALQIASYLKQNYHRPVLALTGWWPDDRDLAIELKSSGVDYFGILPVDAEPLVDALRNCLEHSQQTFIQGNSLSQ